jgi:hypothetical protein
MDSICGCWELFRVACFNSCDFSVRKRPNTLIFELEFSINDATVCVGVTLKKLDDFPFLIGV